MRPAGWSPEDGEGMEVGTEPGAELLVGDATGVRPVKTGLAISCVAGGGKSPEGVDACIVRNKSDVGAGAGPTSPHPRMKDSVHAIHNSLVLIVIQLDRFKVELLAR